MTNEQPKKIGGEFGEVRANIDIESLNVYLAKHVEAVKAPVAVKQFKVSAQSTSILTVLTETVVWAGEVIVSMSSPITCSWNDTVKPDVFLDRFQVSVCTYVPRHLQTRFQTAGSALFCARSLLASSSPRPRTK